MKRFLAILMMSFTMLAAPIQAMAAGPDGMRSVATGIEYSAFYDKLKAAVKESPIGILFVACAHCGAKKIGVTIPKNNVFHVYGPQYAVRMLAASVEAGFEAPLRLYTTEQADGTANLTYQLPSAAFAPYGNADIDTMAAELDGVFEEIIAAATK